MHPSLVADIAAQRQAEILHEAETRRLRSAALRRPGTPVVTAAGSRITRWRRTFSTMMRPAPEPCCA